MDWESRTVFRSNHLFVNPSSGIRVTDGNKFFKIFYIRTQKYFE